MADCRGINRKTLSVTDKLNILKMYGEKSDKKNHKKKQQKKWIYLHRRCEQFWQTEAIFVEGDYCAVEGNSDFKELEEFPGYAEIDEDIATSNTRSIVQIITDKDAPDDVTSIEEEIQEKEDDKRQYRFFQ